MTVLYRLDAPARAVGRAFGLDPGEDPWPGGTVSAMSFAPVITAGREEVAGPRPQTRTPRRLIPRLWGVPPPPSVAEPGGPVQRVVFLSLQGAERNPVVPHRRDSEEEVFGDLLWAVLNSKDFLFNY